MCVCVCVCVCVNKLFGLTKYFVIKINKTDKNRLLTSQMLVVKHGIILVD